MERKTKVTAEDNRQDIVIIREFDLPVELLFLAHTEARLFEQWMSHDWGTAQVLKLESRKYGSWGFQQVDASENVTFAASGIFHEFIPNQKIIRTFEMHNTPFDVQLEFLDFEKLTDDTSKLTLNIVYRSPELREQMLKLPFAHGLNMAHNRLQKIISKLK